jgi:hypothetical protein
VDQHDIYGERRDLLDRDRHADTVRRSLWAVGGVKVFQQLVVPVISTIMRSHSPAAVCQYILSHTFTRLYTFEHKPAPE